MNALIRATALFIAIMSTSSLALAHQRSWPGKRLSEALPEAKNFTQKQATLSASQVDSVQKTLGESIRTEDKTPSFYIGSGADGRSIGVVLFVDAAGENGKIEIGVAINTTGSVIRIVIFESSEGSGATSQKFLSQFTGKKAADKFKVGDDVIVEKGSEKSAQGIATAVRRALLIAKAVLNLGGK